MVDKELTGKVRELKELKLMAEELAAQITSIEDDIKSEMSARNIEELILDVFKVTWKRYTSNRFDTTGFKSAHKDIYDLFAKPVESRRFTIA
jgi:predicted phage-related endonuclease